MSLSLRPSLACTPPASVSVGSMLLTHDPGYIGVFSTPENAAAAPIAMTAPVMIGQPQGQHRHTMMFLLPASRFQTVDEAPEPSNPKVHLRQLPERVVAVRTFSGNLRPERARQEKEGLLRDLEHDGQWGAVRPLDWMAAGYNAPFVLPWFKTNEVHVSVVERDTVSGDVKP